MNKPYDMILPIKKKWYDMILSGEKKEEYRKLSEYYGSRLSSIMGSDTLANVAFDSIESKPFYVLFRNGYSNNSPSFIAKVSVRVDTGLPEWGAEQSVYYFVFSILHISNTEQTEDFNGK